MKLREYLNESKPTMKLKQGVYGKVRVIEGYKNYDRLYVLKKGKHGYCISITPKVDLDSMVEIDNEYWFGTLKEIKKALGI